MLSDIVRLTDRRAETSCGTHCRKGTIAPGASLQQIRKAGLNLCRRDSRLAAIGDSSFWLDRGRDRGARATV